MPPTEDWVSPKTEIRPSPIRGKGLFAIESIAKGEEVVRWGGTFVTAKEAREAAAAGKLVLQFDEDVYSVEERGESPAYFINHSCNPNVWMKGAFVLETMRDIEPGEELTADYIVWEAREDYVSKWECHCGAPSCRKKVTGQDWKNPVLQERYSGHFIPLINKRISARRV